MSLRQDILDNDEIIDIECVEEDLSHLDFSGKTIENVVFKDVKLIGSDFSKATLRNVSFLSSDLSSALFDGAFFFNTIFSYSLFKGTSFINADIRRSTFEDINGLYSVFSSSLMKECAIKDSSFKDTDFTNVRSHKSFLYNVEFKGTSFFHTALNAFKMEKVTFLSSSFSENLKELKGVSLNLESAASILKNFDITLDLSL